MTLLFPVKHIRPIIDHPGVAAGLEVIHRLLKHNLRLGHCRCRTILAQDNWAWCVVKAGHAVLLVRQEHPQLTWRAAQRWAAHHAELYILTEIQRSPQLLDAA